MKVLESFMNRVIPYFIKFAANRHVSAVKDSFIRTIPIVMPASMFILIANVLLSDKFGLGRLLGAENKLVLILKDTSGLLLDGTTNILSFFIVYVIAASLAEKSKAHVLQTGLISLAAFIIVIPDLSGLYTSSKGLFTAILVAIVASEIFIYLSKQDKLTIKMPEQVPPAVAKAFAGLFPSTITLTIIALFTASLDNFGQSLPGLINTTIQAPFLSLAGNAWGLIVLAGVQNLLWTFGIHGAGVLGGVRGLIFVPLADDNLRAFEAGIGAWDLPHLVSLQNYDLYANIGGAGASLCLVIAIFLFSKRSDYRKIAAFAIVPCLFNIAEPVVFGLPIVLNPLMFIPFILAPVVMTSASSYLTYIGFAPKLGITVPWITPVGIGSFLASGNHWQAGVTSIICLIIGIVIYAPFVIMANKISDGNELGKEL